MSQPTSSGRDEHYFAPHREEAGERRTISVHIAGHDRELVTAPGVFSASRLDLGTGVLLRKAPDPPEDAANLLDLGCGWGPVALTMATLAPAATVWAVDVNELALKLTSQNAELLGLANVRAVTPDDVPDDIAFDAIWSNPPIRIGRAELDLMLLRWLPRLAPGAHAFLVVQRNLGSDSLHKWLARRLPEEMPGAEVSRLGSAKGYRVLEVAAAA